MTTYQGTFDAYYEDDARETNIPCEVRIDNGDIVVAYDDDDGPVVYNGKEIEPGHFKLTVSGRKYRATLHRFVDDPYVLEGWWIEDGYQGMWRLTLE